MSLSKEAKAIRYNRFDSENIRQLVFPGTALNAPTGVGAVCLTGAGLTYGNWADVALFGVILTDTLIVGLSFNAVVPLDVYTVDIGLCTAAQVNAAGIVGAPAIAAAHRAEVRISIITLVTGGCQGYIPLDSPVYIPNGNGIVARAYAVGAASTISVKAHCVQLFM